MHYLFLQHYPLHQYVNDVPPGLLPSQARRVFCIRASPPGVWSWTGVHGGLGYEVEHEVALAGPGEDGGVLRPPAEDGLGDDGYTRTIQEHRTSYLQATTTLYRYNEQRFQPSHIWCSDPASRPAFRYIPLPI